MTYGTGTTDNWSGGDLAGLRGLQVNYMRTDANGVKWYQTVSAGNAPGPQALRVLTPTHPAPGVPHNFLYVLPVQAMLGNKYKDGLAALSNLDAQNRYNLTIIAPSFVIDPWYADNPTNPDVQYEDFMTKELVPWVQQHLSVTGHEQNWLLGFSKSGLGAEDLILKHPSIFALAAAWDFPAGMSSYDQYGSDPAASYGTRANFQANYRLTPAFVHAHRGQFQTRTRIWIGGNREFPAYMSNYASLLTKEGILYTRQASQSMSHSWTSGWVPIALAALRHDSLKLPQSHTIKLQEKNNSAAGDTVSPYLIAATVLVALALCGWASWALSRRRLTHVAASADHHGAGAAGPPAVTGQSSPPGTVKAVFPTGWTARRLTLHACPAWRSGPAVCQNSCRWLWPGLSGSSLVFVEEVAEDWPALDLFLGKIGHGWSGRGGWSWSARCGRARASSCSFASDVAGPGVAGAARRDAAHRAPRRDAADRGPGHDRALAPRHRPPPVGAPVAPAKVRPAARRAAMCGRWC